MLAPQLGGDVVEVVEHVVFGQVVAEVASYLGGQVAVAPAQQQRRVQPRPAEAVHGDGDVDVVEEPGESR